MLEWVGGAYGPYALDIDAVNAALNSTTDTPAVRIRDVDNRGENTAAACAEK